MLTRPRILDGKEARLHREGTRGPESMWQVREQGGWFLIFQGFDVPGFGGLIMVGRYLGI